MTKKIDKKTKAPKVTKTANTNEQSAPPAKPKGKKQLEIAGTERKRIPELDEAAEAYRTARNTRQEKTKIEKAKKQELMAAARKHGVKVYVYESEDGEELELEYTAETKENVKVKKVEDLDDDED
jgi:hypothetical protein